jgi:hypothetical protein
MLKGASAEGESLCSFRHQTPRLAFSSDGLRRRCLAVTCATIPHASRAEGEEDQLKRARHQKGTVVFDRRRRTWNFLWREDGQRHSRVIGSKQQFPTKAAAWKAAESLRHSFIKPAARPAITVSTLVAQYRAERMPKRAMTRQGYNTWLDHYIISKWGEHSIWELQARPVDLWLQSLALSPKSKVHIRGLIRALWDFAMWRGDVPIQRNPMELVTITGASKRVRKVRSLTVEEFQRLAQQLESSTRFRWCVSASGCGSVSAWLSNGRTLIG